MKEKKENTLNNWEKLRRGEQQTADSAGPLPKLWEGSSAYGQDFQPDVEAGLQRLKHRIQADEARIVPLSSRFSGLRKAAAVAILALVASASYFYLNSSSQAAAWTTVATAANETRALILPDGSSVQLNEETRLSYRTDLNTADQRSIELEGEAFFDVNRRPDQPFIINTARAEVKVLGTSFNVRAVAGTARTEVEVSTGKVAVRGLEAGEETVVLEATDAVVVEDDYQLYMENNSPLNGDAWLTGKLSFRGVDLSSALDIIERTYQVDLRWDPTAVRNCTITGNWATESFSDVLLLLEGLTGMNIKAMGGDVYQLSGSCQ